MNIVWKWALGALVLMALSTAAVAAPAAATPTEIVAVAEPDDAFTEGGLLFWGQFRFGYKLTDGQEGPEARWHVPFGFGAVVETMVTEYLAVGGFLSADYNPSDKLGNAAFLSVGPELTVYVPLMTPPRVRYFVSVGLGYVHGFDLVGQDGMGAVANLDTGILVRLDDGGTLFRLSTGINYAFLYRASYSDVSALTIPVYAAFGRAF